MNVCVCLSLEVVVGAVHCRKFHMTEDTILSPSNKNVGLYFFIIFLIFISGTRFINRDIFHNTSVVLECYLSWCSQLKYWIICGPFNKTRRYVTIFHRFSSHFSRFTVNMNMNEIHFFLPGLRKMMERQKTSSF